MPPPTTITATFPTKSQANAAIDALAEAGLNRSLISLDTTQPDAETSFLIRLVAIIVLWSIAGGAIGAGMGALIWLVLGPDGTGGLIIQTVSWLIFGHIVAGLWAGYLLLADRTSAELPHERTTTRLVIRCPEEHTRNLAESILERAEGRTALDLPRTDLPP